MDNQNPASIEDRAVVELLRVVDQQITVGGLAAEVHAQAIGDLIDAWHRAGFPPGSAR